MWIGVILGLLGFIGGFFGLRAKWLQDGKISQSQRQQAHAEMVSKAVRQKDLIVDTRMKEKIEQIQAAVSMRLRKPKKTLVDVQDLLSRTRKWPPKT